MKTIYLSLGSNIGKRFINIHRGLSEILAHPSVSYNKISSLYFTEPVDYEHQNWFVNVIIKVYTSLSPMELLIYAKEVESRMGRMKQISKGPRIIDIDILLYENETIRCKELTIPHPELHKRNFILRALIGMGEDIYHPVLHKNISQIYHELQSDKKTFKIPGWLSAILLHNTKHCLTCKLLFSRG
jgi:2-amino-4-hydroxy-6-hydroxymethyldihydropteridine diphosphokinase